MGIAADELLRDQIRSAYREYAAALARHDAGSLAAMYDDDAVILAPGAPPIAGRDAIRAYCEGICALPYQLALSGFTIENLLRAGDCVIEVSRFTSASTCYSDSDVPVVKKSKNLVVWRNRGGRWLIARDMYSDVRT